MPDEAIELLREAKRHILLHDPLYVRIVEFLRVAVVVVESYSDETTSPRRTTK